MALTLFVSIEIIGLLSILGIILMNYFLVKDNSQYMKELRKVTLTIIDIYPVF